MSNICVFCNFIHKKKEICGDYRCHELLNTYLTKHLDLDIKTLQINKNTTATNKDNDLVIKKSKHKKYTCEKCNKLLSSKENYLNHIKKNICNKQPFKCPTCNKIFTNKRNLDIHVNKNICSKTISNTTTADNITNIQNQQNNDIENNVVINTNDNSDKEQNKKYKKVKINLPLKKAVWYKYVGCDIGSTYCFCCELNKLTQLDFVCGHVIPESKGGLTNVDNLLPICGSCNSSMGNKHMFEFMLKCGFKVSHLTKLFVKD
jgi:hypothetical protein